MTISIKSIPGLEKIYIIQSKCKEEYMQFKLTFSKKFIFVAVLLACAGSVYAAKTYEGEIFPLVKDKLTSGTDFAYWGMLQNTSRVGTIIKPQITNLKGKVIDKGTVIIQLETKYWTAMLSSSEAALDAAEQNLLTAKENYYRYKKLTPTGATPLQLYQIMRAAYYTALGNYKEAQANLIESRSVLDACTHIAPFEGIVDKVYFSRGHDTDNPASIEVSQLNPIGIKIVMLREEANAIVSDTPISVYFDNSNKPIGVYNSYSIMVSDGIILITENFPEITGKHDSKKVRDCYSVINFYSGNNSDNPLGVPIDALNEDKKGFYVWRAVDRKTMQAGKGMDPTFQIEKVYVIPGNFKRLYLGVTFIRILKDPGTLQMYDVLLSKPPINLKEADWVTLLPERYELMPGDTVKVVIGD